MALTYTRAWSRQQQRDARNFFLDRHLPVDPQVPGLCEGTTREDAAAVIDDMTIYYAAYDGDKIVAVHCLKDLNEFGDRSNWHPDHYLFDVRWQIVGYASDPAYDPHALFWNMMQGLRQDIMEPGDKWNCQQTPGPATDYLLSLPWTDYADEPKLTANDNIVVEIYGTRADEPSPLLDVAVSA